MAWSHCVDLNGPLGFFVLVLFCVLFFISFGVWFLVVFSPPPPTHTHFEETGNTMNHVGPSDAVLEEWLFLDACQAITRRSFIKVLESTIITVRPYCFLVGKHGK